MLAHDMLEASHAVVGQWLFERGFEKLFTNVFFREQLGRGGRKQK
jgi:hypothetical protein